LSKRSPIFALDTDLDFIDFGLWKRGEPEQEQTLTKRDVAVADQGEHDLAKRGYWGGGWGGRWGGYGGRWGGWGGRWGGGRWGGGWGGGYHGW
ncbi:hypothetical protein JCM11491_006832, partial [Sporobolomyces phaffii]